MLIYLFSKRRWDFPPPNRNTTCKSFPSTPSLLFWCAVFSLSCLEWLFNFPACADICYVGKGLDVKARRPHAALALEIPLDARGACGVTTPRLGVTHALGIIHDI